MNSSWIKSLLVTMPLSAVLTLSGCGSSPTAPSVSPPSSPPSTAESSVVAMPAAATILPGQSQQFVAQVSGLSDKTVTWQVEGSGGGTITSTGLYTAPSATGVYTVIATSSAGANYSAAALVLVTAKPSPFSPTGNLVYGREFHTATLLADGTVLVAGGGEYEAYCTAGSDFAELYDPVSGSFALTSSMTDRRYAQTSTLLQNGKVLITGGFSFDKSACFNAGTSPPLISAELYDPSSGSFAPTGSMSEARGLHTATLLSTGKVLIVGGGNGGGGRPPFAGDGSATAEVYDPATGTFTPTASMSTARIGHTATLLLDGKVLVAGGITSGSSGSLVTHTFPLATAELYDPVTGTFTVVATMTVPRAGHTATLLRDGNVLISGGFTDSTLGAAGVGTGTAEIYDPAKATFLPTNKPVVLGRWAHTATLLPDGTVLLVGGGSSVAETYSPPDGSFSAIGLDESDRLGHTATLLKNGSVVIIGGFDYGKGPLTTAELYR